ncbi:Putative transcriptional regulator [Ruminococcaceae bacterium BL-4]|nr:Putative transcriptional regulator [Ruminococcaceae bacterium BL-4]
MEHSGDMMSQNIKADKTIGENIRKWRSAKGMTQEQLSAQLQVRGCDISRGTLAKIEAGIRHISVEELNAIKAVLDIAYDDFFSQG